MTDERLSFGAAAFDAAVARFSATEQGQYSELPSTHAAEAALVECAWWCQMLNERLQATHEGYVKARGDDDGGRTVQGVRFARNRYSHSPVVIIAKRGGISFPISFPVTFGIDVVWRGLGELPPDDQDRAGQRAAYAELLAGRRVRETLGTVAQWFRSWGVPVNS